MAFTLVDKVAEKQPAISTTKNPVIQPTKTPVYKVWQYGLWSFQVGGIIFFFLRINTIKGILRILRIGLLVRCQKVPKFDFQSYFFKSKIV